MKGKNRCNKQLDFFRVRIEQEQYRKAILCMEEEQYDKAIILFEGLPRDYEDARIRCPMWMGSKVPPIIPILCLMSAIKNSVLFSG